MEVVPKEVPGPPLPHELLFGAAILGFFIEHVENRGSDERAVRVFPKVAHFCSQVWSTSYPNQIIGATYAAAHGEHCASVDANAMPNLK